MRGKVIDSCKFFAGIGITPAYAGKSSSLRPPIPFTTGSPPPMRGKVFVCDQCDCLCRITPAYAGKSSPFGSRTIYPVGSPPPMRGKATRRIAAAVPLRITPAYAGKRLLPWQYTGDWWDHPRLCGEKGKKIRKAQPKKGSPPPMRGKAAFDNRFRNSDRITPAYAGKRLAQGVGAKQVKDHPRLCGEKSQTEHDRIQSRWITPAYAGKRSSLTCTPECPWDHPRLCGEK